MLHPGYKHCKTMPVTKLCEFPVDRTLDSSLCGEKASAHVREDHGMKYTLVVCDEHWELLEQEKNGTV